MPLEDTGLRVDRSTKTLRERTVERLRDAILNFQFKAGERLVERTLCDRLGVSRTVVREALRHLEAEGLVEILPQQGPAVARPDTSQAAQVYEIRALLEAEAARAAAANADEADVARLVDANRAIQAAFAEGTSRDVLKATTEFYELLFTIAGKSVAWQLVQGLNARINYLRAMTISRPNRSADAGAEMVRIIEAIARRDGKAAAKASFEHVETVKRLAVSMLEDVSLLRTGP
ncbi:MAG: GntR family transcriptional regulator [Acidisphaera sp.]|nr:GntR family transcriptional regulator [Acidisphaera sp.]